jgi:multidrug transporter EmrE-like cation transporter
MSEGPWKAFLLLLFAISLSVTGEFLLKAGMNQVGVLSLAPKGFISGLLRAFSNPKILAGFAIIFSGSLIWLAVLSRADLSWAYPMLSLGYLFVVLTSWFFLGEAFSLLRVMGTVFICLGVLLTFRS